MIEKDITKRLSKSKINSFITCPKKYWFEQNFPEEFVANEAMKRGSELHQIFEDTYTKLMEVPKENKAFKEQVLKLENANKYEEQVSKFADWQEQFNFIKPESIEEKVYDPELDIVVMWDRIDYDGKKRCLIDYKSGKKKGVKQFRFELMLYAFIFMKVKRKPIDYVGIYFIDYGVFDTIPVTDEEMKWVNKELYKIREEMSEYQKSQIWPCKKSWMCNYCSYKPKCPLYKVYKF